MASNTNLDPSASLDELRRAELLTHTRYPRLGSWYPPTVGAVAAVWTAGYAAPDGFDVAIAGVCAIAVALGAGAYVRKRGVSPSMRKAPPEIRRVFISYVFAAFAFVAVCALLFNFATWWIAGTFAFVAATAGVSYYERSYASAAHDAEANSGLIDEPGST